MTTKTHEPLFSFTAHQGGTTSASFSPDGRTLATGGYDCAIRFWDVERWQEKLSLPGHRRGEVAFSPDSRLLLSGGLHKDAVVYDTATWQIVQTLNDSGGVWGLAFRPDGSEAILIEPDDNSEERSLRPVEFWDICGWAMTGTANVGMDYVYSLSISPDGGCVALAHYPNGMVSLWTGDFGRKLLSFPAHHQATWGVSFSADGAILATGGADNVARLWDTASWQMRDELPHKPMAESADYQNGVLCTAFSPNGKLLVTGGLDGTIHVWKLDRL